VTGWQRAAGALYRCYDHLQRQEHVPLAIRSASLLEPVVMPRTGYFEAPDPSHGKAASYSSVATERRPSAIGVGFECIVFDRSGVSQAPSECCGNPDE
jgi:hypothetical protein